MHLYLLKNLILLLLAVPILFSALLLNHVHVISNTSIINIPDQLRRLATKTQKFPQLGKDARLHARMVWNLATQQRMLLKRNRRNYGAIIPIGAQDLPFIEPRTISLAFLSILWTQRRENGFQIAFL
jgi:hypothetical protein